MTRTKRAVIIALAAIGALVILAVLVALVTDGIRVLAGHDTGGTVADFSCSIDRPGIGGLFTLTTKNPGTSTIYVGTVQVNFYDGAGNLIDTQTTDVEQQVGPGRSVVTHDAEEVSAPPVICRETSWTEQP